MPIDRRYGRVTLEHGDIPDDELVVVFRAEDRLLPDLLTIYAEMCARAGEPAVYTAGVALARDEIMEWQAVNPVRSVPEAT